VVPQQKKMALPFGKAIFSFIELLLSGCYFWLIALSFQELFPTGRVKVQYSSNLTGSVLLPESTAPVVSSVV
jgi:hypothetical protein